MEPQDFCARVYFDISLDTLKLELVLRLTTVQSPDKWPRDCKRPWRRNGWLGRKAPRPHPSLMDDNLFEEVFQFLCDLRNVPYEERSFSP